MPVLAAEDALIRRHFITARRYSVVSAVVLSSTCLCHKVGFTFYWSQRSSFVIHTAPSVNIEIKCETFAIFHRCVAMSLK